MPDTPIATALTIAGSDCSGGAGIQADLKTFTALGVYGMSAITALTAQNTRGVSGVHAVPAAFVTEQLDRICEDIPPDAVKTGMLYDAGIIEAVAEAIERHGLSNLVVDPVMVAKSGDILLKDSARQALCDRLLPLALVLTPNLPEAEVLTGVAIESEDAMRVAAERLRAMGPRYILLKGGHRTGADVTDYLLDGDTMHEMRAPRVDTPNTHGTGCTYSAAIAACLARGQSVEQAVSHAKEYVHGAIVHNLGLGSGHGPLDHMWRMRGE